MERRQTWMVAATRTGSRELSLMYALNSCTHHTPAQGRTSRVQGWRLRTNFHDELCVQGSGFMVYGLGFGANLHDELCVGLGHELREDLELEERAARGVCRP